MKKIVVVIGMHRSGTSTITRGLQALGVDLGSNLMPGIEGNNEKGFWEDLDINALNIEVLKTLNHDWHTLSLIRQDNILREELEPLIAKAVTLLKEKISKAAIFGMKDPRFSLLLPFWKISFKIAGIEPSFIIASRHPMSIALSLKQRDGFDSVKSYYLWMEYMVSSMLDSAGYPRVVASYDELMDHPEAQLRRIAKQLNLRVDVGNEAALHDYKDNFLEERLRHTRYSTRDLVIDSDVPKDVITAYELLEQLAQDKISLDSQIIHRTFSDIDQRLRQLDPAFRYVSTLEDNIVKQTLMVSEYKTQATALNQVVTERDAQISTFKRGVAKRDAQISAFKRDVAERDALLATLQQTITERESHVSTLDQELAIKDRELVTKDQELATKDQNIIALTHKLSEQDLMISALLYNNDRLNAFLRMTAPFRLVKRSFINAFHPVKALRLACDIRIIKRSNLFDSQFYLAHNHEVRLSNWDPIRHYCVAGWKERRDPSAEFDTGYYLQANEDVLAAGINPLVHFLMTGRAEGRHPQSDMLASDAVGVCAIPNHGAAALRLAAPQRFIKQFTARVLGALVRTMWNEFFTNRRMRSLYASIKQFSVRMVQPLAPWLHNLFFIKLKTHLKTNYLHSKCTENILSSSNLYSIAQSVPPNFNPMVSIIVPNYNHSRFLRKRLDSVYGQAFRNFEVILLDDASTDGSVEILKEYAHRYPEITRCYFNEVNSGGVFNQWRLGINKARGDLIWIAESDDYCSENMLSSLVRFFANEAVMLSYCKSVFVKGETEEPVWSIEEYLMELDADLWRNDFIVSAHNLVGKAWAIKNIVPNVSSALFRHPGAMQLLDDKEWRQMSICGDWIFYLHLIRGGLIAYTNQATNYFRIHENNTSVSTYSKDIYYKEHEKVAQEATVMYRLQEDVFDHQRQILKSHWRRWRHDYSEVAFKRCYDYDRIRHLAEKRKPNILMLIYALAAGGGETFPIKLANMLKEAGYGTTVLNLQQAPTEAGIRQMLRRDIPLVEIDALLKLDAVVADLGIELIHSHHAWVDMTCCSILAGSTGSRSIVTMHGMYEMIPSADLAAMAPLLNQRVAKFIYTADKNLLAFSPDNFDLNNFIRIDNALDIMQITPVPRSELGIPDDSFVLCLVSRAIPEKGWEEAIAAVNLARKIARREIHLLLIGEGPEYERLKPITRDAYIHFLGFRPKIRNYFATADMGLLPSRFNGESFPLVLIDCLHSGRPVIATRIGEISRMLDTELGPAGTVLDIDNWTISIDELAEIIVRYVNNDDLYLDHLARVPAAAAKFDPAVMLQNYETVYQEIFEEMKRS